MNLSTDDICINGQKIKYRRKSSVYTLYHNTYGINIYKIVNIETSNLGILIPEIEQIIYSYIPPPTYFIEISPAKITSNNIILNLEEQKQFSIYNISDLDKLKILPEKIYNIVSTMFLNFNV
jgi:hypothetical protein